MIRCLRLSSISNYLFPISSKRLLSNEIPEASLMDCSQGALKRFFVDKIRATGPITVAEYMRTAISAPTVGYYGRFSEKQQVFGESGDFITSPELTQMFGEMIGVWCYYELANTGHNGSWNLIENGPGTGQLISDILTVMKKFKTSDALIDQQERLLCAYNSTPPKSTPSVQGPEPAEEEVEMYISKDSYNLPYVRYNKSKTGAPVYWYKNLDDVPEGFSVFVSNEFLDALPVHQFARDSQGKWHEIYVNINNNNNLVFMRSRGENLHTQGLLKPSIRDDLDRKFWEVSSDAGTYVNQVVERIVHHGGFALIIDYGHDGSRRDLSLRAYNPLSRPGEIDLTADVNFGHLKELIEDRAVVYGPNTQREFLSQMGIQYRLRQLLKACSERQQQENIIKAYNYLMGEMGEKFHAMSVFPKTLGSILEKRGGPAGFSTGPSTEGAKHGVGKENESLDKQKK